MALDANTVWEARTGGDDLNGGGYVSDAGTTDYSQQDAAQLALTDIDQASAASTTITSVTGGFTAAMVGNVIQLTSGTNLTVGFYEIATRVDTNTITLDRAPDDGTALTGDTVGKVGGALATPGMLGKVIADHGVDGMDLWLKSATYTLTNSNTNTAGGPLSLVTGITCIAQGYETTRGDLTGTRPVIDAGAQTSITILEAANVTNTDDQALVNIDVDGNGGSGVLGIKVNIHGSVTLCDAVDCPGGGIQSSTRPSLCKATGCTTFGINSAGAHLCTANDNAGASSDGFRTAGASDYFGCLAHNNGRHGFFVTSSSLGRRRQWTRCTADNNGSDGFNISSQGPVLISCLMTNNGGYGFSGNITRAQVMIGCASKSNTSGRTNVSILHDVDPIILTADPYVAIGSDDFRPNDTSGGGAELRGAAEGVPGQTDNQDVGAVQHTDPAGGGMLIHPGMTGGIRG